MSEEKIIMNAGAAVANLANCISLSGEAKAKITLEYASRNAYYSAVAQIKQRLQAHMYEFMSDVGHHFSLTVNGVRIELKRPEEGEDGAVIPPFGKVGQHE